MSNPLFRTRCVNDDSCLNLRDLGGLPEIGGGYTSRGVLFRSGAFLSRGDNDVEKIALQLGLCSYIDLRTSAELRRDNWHRRLEAVGVKHICAPLSIPRFSELLGETPQPSDYTKAYVRLVHHAYEQISDILKAIALAPWPLIFGCSLGKDRTAVVAALILISRGVRKDIIARDHALSARQLERRSDRLSDDRRRKGISPLAYARRLSATPGAMLDFLDWWAEGNEQVQKTAATFFAPNLEIINNRWPVASAINQLGRHFSRDITFRPSYQQDRL